MNANLLLLISAAGMCVACALHADVPSASEMREFHEASAEASGAQILRDLPIPVVVLPGKPYSDEQSYRSAALVLLERHPAFKPEKVGFWQPTVDEVRKGFDSVLKKSSDTLRNAISQKKPKLACQVVGVTVRDKKVLLYNFVPDKSLDSQSFYITPEAKNFTRPWPFSGSALLDAGTVEFSVEK